MIHCYIKETKTTEEGCIIPWLRYVSVSSLIRVAGDVAAFNMYWNLQRFITLFCLFCTYTQTYVHTQTLAVAHTDPRAHTKVSEPWGQWGHLPRNTETARVKVSFHSRNNLPSLSDDYSPKEPKMHQNSWRPGLCPGPHWGSLHHSPDCLAGGVKAYWPLPKNSTIGSVLSSFKLWPIGLALPPAMLILFRRHCAHHTLACGMHTHHMHVHAPTTI